MLYTSTRNASDTYTAHRALCEERAPDGGFYVPFHLPVFTAAELSGIQKQSFEDTVAQILNLFFGLRLAGADICNAVGANIISEIDLGQKVTVAEIWHNPMGEWENVRNHLYELASKKNSKPIGWSCIALEIAMLFGVYSASAYMRSNLDIAVTTENMADMTAVLFSKVMGLPIRLTVCACDEKSTLWDLLNKGSLSVGGTHHPYMEVFVYQCLGRDAVSQYIDAMQNKTVCQFNDEQMMLLNSCMYASVVSDNRAETVISSMYNTNRYTLDAKTALAYGALQDYRANTGINRNTLIISKQRPTRTKE